MNYEDIKYKRQVRITDEQLVYLRFIKGRSSLAGKLDEIINFYKQHGNIQNTTD